MALTNSQYDSLIRQYNQLQLRNRQVQKEREEKLYAAIPDLAALDDEVSRLSVESIEKRLAGDVSTSDAIKEKISQIPAKRQAMILAAGFDPEDFLPTYDCPDCQDTGFINGKKCHCFIQRTVDLVYAQSHLDDILQKENFSTFSFDYYSDSYIDERSGLSSLESAKDAYQNACNFVQHFSTKDDNLLLYGETGTGKTFLSNCIAKALLDQGHSVIYLTAYEIFDLFEKKVFKKDEDAAELHEYILQCDLLIIDDLGTEASNSFTTSQLFFLLNERLLHQKSTIISTNLSFSQLADTYSERTTSRIFSNYQTCKLFGDDIRIKKKISNKS